MKTREFLHGIWKKMDPDPILTNVEQLAFDIFKICLNDNNNIRYLNTNASVNKKYIVTKSYILDKNITTFIIINSSANKITIINHQYRYDISMPTKACMIMDKMFNNKVEEERQEMEKEILSNITESLETVLTQFKEKLI